MILENTEFYVTLLALIFSLMGNVLQYIFPVKKGRAEESSLISEAAKNISEAYSMALSSLRDRVLALEKDLENDKILIESLQETVKKQEVKIKEQDDQIKSLKKTIEKFGNK